MDGRSEVWTCSLTRFVWHLILFHSWIACIGLPLPLIVSFFEDCYRQNSYVYSATPFLFTVSKCHSFTQDKRPSASRRALMDFEGGQPICSHIDYAQDFHFLSSFCLVPTVPPSLFLGDKILPCAAIPTFFAVPNIIFIWEMCHLNAIIQTFLERARFIQFPVLGNMRRSTKYCPSTYGTTHCFAISQ